MKKNEHLVYSAVGLVALFLLLVALNFLLGARAAARRPDRRQRLHAVARARRRSCAAWTSPVKVKLYVSQGEQAVPVPLRSFAQRVEDLVREFKQAARRQRGRRALQPASPTPRTRTRRSSTASSRSS